MSSVSASTDAATPTKHRRSGPSISATAFLKSLARKHLRGTNLLEHMAGRVNARVSYSQFGEDLHIRSFYDRLAHDRGIVVNGGCIVDIGAFRPIAFSNGYGFYRDGWHCIINLPIIIAIRPARNA